MPRGIFQRRSIQERFEKKIERIPECGCWIWTGTKWGSYQYGTMWKDGKRIFAHRVSWELHFGKIPNGLSVLHRCDTALCVNPNHLFLGTYKDNLQDAAKKKRLFLCCQGEKHPGSKLTESQVVEILKTSISERKIAVKYNVKRGAINSIRSRRTWKHINP